MRRLGRLAPALAAAVLTLRAAPVAAEPLDVTLSRLGPANPAVWQRLGADAASAQSLAADARRRFAILSNEVALAMSSALLQPGSTTGHSGFDVAAEATYGEVHDTGVGDSAAANAFGFTGRPWATTSATPGALATTGVHVRKALPFSIELGGRFTSLVQTSYLAAQGELKVALNEGFEDLPDVAVRVAYTRLFGARDWNLDTTDLDLLVSKRWGVSGVTSFTPYLAARFALVSASSDRIVYAAPAGSAPGELNDLAASFPRLRSTLYRTTLGVRMTANVVSLALEATYFAGASVGKASPGPGDYPSQRLASAFTGAFKLGWEF
jgi:hypothetical protein